MGFTSFLDPIFDPLLNLHPFLSIFIMSFLVTFLITLVYKYTTDQKKMKQLKEDLKKTQDKIKQLAKESKPDEALKVQNEAMQKNLEYMKHSFKSTLYTMIPVLVLFAWMSVNLAYYPIAPGQEFTVTAIFADGHAPNATLSAIPDLATNSAAQQIAYDEKSKQNQAVWKLRAPSEGEYKVTISYNGEQYDHTVLISSGRKYSSPEKLIENSKLKKIVVGNDKVYPFTLFGLRFTWFWAYLIISIALSILIRKIMKVY